MSDELRDETFVWARARWDDAVEPYVDAPLSWALQLRVPLDSANWDVKLAQSELVEGVLRRIPEYAAPRGKPWPTPREETRIAFTDLEGAAAAAKLLVGETHRIGPICVGIGFGPTVDGDGPAWWAARDAVEAAQRHVVYQGYAAIDVVVPDSLRERAIAETRR